MKRDGPCLVRILNFMKEWLYSAAVVALLCRRVAEMALSSDNGPYNTTWSRFR